MKRKKEKVLSLVLCIAVVLSSMFAFNFGFPVFADDNTNTGDTGTTTQPTTINNTLPSETSTITSTVKPTTKPTTTVPTTTKPVVKPISVGNISKLKVTKISSNYITVK